MITTTSLPRYEVIVRHEPANRMHFEFPIATTVGVCQPIDAND